MNLSNRLHYIEQFRYTSQICISIAMAITYGVCVVGDISMHVRFWFTFSVSLIFLLTWTSRGICFHRVPILGRKFFRAIIFSSVTAVLLFVPYLMIAHKIPDIGLRYPLRVAQGIAPWIEQGPKISVVIPYQNEVDGFLFNTISSLYKNTRDDLLFEIIIVDDGSDELVSIEFLEKKIPKIILLRNDEPQGLTRSKIRGADSAKGTHILFLDAHCKVAPYWAEFMLARSARASYRDIVIPQVVSVDAKNFAFESFTGYSQLIFDWNFEFSWITSDSEEAPILPGGIQLMTRKRWVETKYDQEMRLWGGENIEQSLMTWMCGGSILVESRAIIGHVFERPSVFRDINIVIANQARAAFVWLDESLAYFKARHTTGARILDDMDLNGIDLRLELRHRLGCRLFTDYMEKFDKIFDGRGLLIWKETSIMHVQSGQCLSAVAMSEQGKMHNRPVRLEWDTCQPYSAGQRFTPVRGDVLIRSVAYERCLERRGDDIVLEPCEYMQVRDEQIFSFLAQGWLGPSLEPTGELRKNRRTCLAGPSETQTRVTHVSCSQENDSAIKFRPIFSGV